MFKETGMPTPEKKEVIEARIRLHLHRHSIKDSDPNAQDENIILSKEGRELAADQVGELENPRLARVIGTSRVRTIETGSLLMDGNIEKSTKYALVEKNTLGTPRVAVDGKDRLNFLVNPDTPTGKAAYDAFGEGCYFEWLINESDDSAREHKDGEGNPTYSGSAADVASMVKEYVNSITQWEGILEKDRELAENPNIERDQKYKETLDRFLVSHAGVTESFLAKVIEKTQGIEIRDKFAQVLKASGSFKEAEGFTIDIVKEVGGVSINVDYDKKDSDDTTFSFHQRITKEVINEIISEGV